MTIRELVLEYFIKNPNKDIRHGSVVDCVTKQWLQTKSAPPRDIWRIIRSLHQEGFLIKVKRGVYRYEPESINTKTLEDFTAQQKEEIFSRDNYRCVICGRGLKDGVEIHADHIKPKDKGFLIKNKINNISK